MENIEMKVEGDRLIITVDLSVDLGPSKSGKTRVIASTRGNAKVPNSDAMAGINIYRKV
jgi:hypothetical protein